MTLARERWFADRLAPTLLPLIELGPDAALVTHGPPVLTGATAALERGSKPVPGTPDGVVVSRRAAA